ncbi:MAG: hypothetical protein N3A62_06990 [Thermodesulfovibrionales bacterium]|nr:hypothetical protein [Thermodesulfovibrionales bacterium]
MEVKKEGIAAIISIFANVSQFMKSLAELLQTGDFDRLPENEKSEIIKNIQSISNFLNETGVSLHFMIEGPEDDKTTTT